jgi:transaldolase
MTSDTRHDPLAELSAQGVAVWLDDLSRELLASGELQLLITGRHVVGVTTNPTIFASALAKGGQRLAELGTQGRAPRTRRSVRAGDICVTEPELGKLEVGQERRGNYPAPDPA